jgi:hypothetical protein
VHGGTAPTAAHIVAGWGRSPRARGNPLFHDEQVARATMDRVRQSLEKVTLILRDPDGTVVVYERPGFSYGT